VLDSVREAAPAADSQAELAWVPMARPVEESAERARALAAVLVSDSEAESVVVLLAPAWGSASDSAEGPAGFADPPVADFAEQAAGPVGRQVVAVAVSGLSAPAANPLAESPADLVAGSAVDLSGGRTTMR